jgi:hypothetical protein
MGETWNWVAWSISVEFWTYLLFRPRLERALLLVTAAMIAFMVLAPHYQALWIRWVDLAKCVYGFGVVLCIAIISTCARTIRSAWIGVNGWFGR